MMFYCRLMQSKRFMYLLWIHYWETCYFCVKNILLVKNPANSLENGYRNGSLPSFVALFLDATFFTDASFFKPELAAPSSICAISLLDFFLAAWDETLAAISACFSDMSDTLGDTFAEDAFCNAFATCSDEALVISSLPRCDEIKNWYESQNIKNAEAFNKLTRDNSFKISRLKVKSEFELRVRRIHFNPDSTPSTPAMDIIGSGIAHCSCL